jgi:hypothetical protein
MKIADKNISVNLKQNKELKAQHLKKEILLKSEKDLLITGFKDKS